MGRPDDLGDLKNDPLDLRRRERAGGDWRHSSSSRTSVPPSM